MAFTGIANAVINQISDRVVRITGLSLAGLASGTISFTGGPASDVALPAAFTPDDVPNATATMVDRTRVTVQQTASAATGMPYHVVKNAGVGGGPASFQITITNDGAAASGALEIYIDLLG